MKYKNMRSGQVDLRGFKYALEPLHTRQEWKTQSLLRELARAQTVCQAATQRLQLLQGAFDDQSDVAKRTLNGNLDPQTHRGTLAYLMSLRQQIDDAVETESQARERRRELFAGFVKQKTKLEALDEHRNSEVSSYAKEAMRLEQIRADQDWISMARLKNSLSAGSTSGVDRGEGS
jgi:flagellar biosynthesis chaperone FliJ